MMSDSLINLEYHGNLKSDDFNDFLDLDGDDGMYFWLQGGVWQMDSEGGGHET